MTRTRSLPISLPVFIVLAAIVAIAVFGLTRWTLQSDANTLPPLDVAGDSAAAAPGALNAAKLYEQRVRTVVA
ncbi:MAG: hypothetical protein JWM25_783, partial [Thermoleophilia bacterium]|nr:hypothetical protein [Thermoleophilia bacterium]